MSKIFEQILKQKGIDVNFLYPKYEDLSDPFLLPDMQKAVDRIARAIQDSEKMLIYGDYDADGVTSSTLMEEALKLAGVKSDNISIMLPDRFVDGYGMSPRLIKQAKATDVKLVITVDCGSRNHEIIEELNFLSIDTIVTDHHEVSESLPEAVAVINPKRSDFTDINGLKNLAGVGVAFKVAEALVSKNFIQAGQEKWLLDLVLIGTICDNMVLTGENRILSFYGIKVLEKTRRTGLKELMRATKIGKINSESIGFQIGPRLNVAGRLESAEIALNLLRTNSKVTAAALVKHLEDLNKKRKQEQNTAIQEINARGVDTSPVIIETGNWSEGILGIIASRLVEEYRRPAFVLSEVKEGIFKGSARSFGDFNLAEALRAVGDTIVGGGGHAGAAGVQVERKHIYEFRERINQYYRNLNLQGQEKYLRQHSNLDLLDFSQLSLDFYSELSLLEPYGAGNEEPIFRLKNVKIIATTRMGAEKNHLRLDLRDRNGKSLKLVAFYAPDEWLKLTPDSAIEPLIKLTLNDFNGVKSLEARLVDFDYIDA